MFSGKLRFIRGNFAAKCYFLFYMYYLGTVNVKTLIADCWPDCDKHKNTHGKQTRQRQGQPMAKCGKRQRQGHAAI